MDRSVTDFPSTWELSQALKGLDGESKAEEVEGREDETLDVDWDWVLANYDVGTTEPQSMSQELHRLSVLKSYLILDSEREEAFDRLTTMASRIFKVPIALVSLVDLGRQFLLSTHGLDVRQTPRNIAFCAHAIQGRCQTFIVPDATQDPRFSENPLVTGAPHIRFYAGAPLLSPEGYKLGTFCVIDDKPRHDFSEEDQAHLIDFAAIVVEKMVDRRKITSQAENKQLVACTAHDLLTPLSAVQLSLSLLQDDPDLHNLLSESNQESLTNAARSSDWLHRICQTAIDTLRSNASPPSSDKTAVIRDQHEDQLMLKSPFIDMKEFIANLNLTMEPIPKRVPLILTVDDSVPAKIVSDDLKLFRSSLNLLSNAFANTESGSVHLHIYSEKNSLVFKCIDTGRDLNIGLEERDCLFKPCLNRADASDADLGLYSIALQVESLGGSYGYRPRAEECRNKCGSIFWFQVPIVPYDAVVKASKSFLNNDGDISLLESTIKRFPPVEYGDSNSSNTPRRASVTLDYAASRTGISAVAAAAAMTTIRPSNSCCRLDKLENLNDHERVSPYYSSAAKVKDMVISPGVMMKGLQKTRISDTSINMVTAIDAFRGNVGIVAGNDHKLSSHECNEKPEDTTKEEVFALFPCPPAVGPNTGPQLGIQVQPETASLARTSCSGTEDHNLKVKKALIIEDTLVVRKTLTRALQKRGYEVTQAVDGLEGLEALKTTVYELTLCDFLMPNLDGLDCVAQYRNWERENRPWFQQYIVGISAHVSQNDVLKGLEIGMNDFKAKPITMKMLEELDNCTAVKKARRVLSQVRAKYHNESIPSSGSESSFSSQETSECRPIRESITKRQICLMATGRATGEIGITADQMKSQGWHVQIVQSGQVALEQLKSRNWGAVVLDDDLPDLSGRDCVERFRIWERHNRVNRQDNLFIVCTDILVSNPETSILPPAGFDGVMDGKVLWSDLESLIAREKTSFLGREGLSIVTR